MRIVSMTCIYTIVDLASVKPFIWQLDASPSSASLLMLTTCSPCDDSLRAQMIYAWQAEADSCWSSRRASRRL
jgi:hypothetical protein